MDTIFYVQRAIIECNCLTDGTGDSSRGTPSFPNSSIPFSPKVLNLFQDLVKGGTPQGTKHLVRKNVYIIFVSVTSIDIVHLGELFCVPKPGFNLRSGDT